MIARHVHALLRDALADTPVVLVNGARQVGKSTLVRDPAGVGAGRRYLALDDPGVLAAARRDPVGFVEGLALPTTLDEIQLAPELLPAIKMAIDQRREPGGGRGSSPTSRPCCSGTSGSWRRSRT